MRKFVIVLPVLALVLGIGGVAYASSAYEVNSSGIFRYDGNNNGSYTDSEDIYIDSSDLVNINSHVSTLKTGFDDYILRVDALVSDVEALESGVSSIGSNLGGLRFGVNTDGEYGYYGEDDSFVPFNDKNVAYATSRVSPAGVHSFTVGEGVVVVSFVNQTGDDERSYVNINGERAFTSGTTQVSAQYIGMPTFQCSKGDVVDVHCASSSAYSNYCLIAYPVNE